jgi:hypothetical protein
MLVSIDIETLSTRNDAACIAIGAVIFDQTHIVNQFETYLWPTLTPGHRDPKTIDWWMKQNNLVREKVWGGLTTPVSACESLSRFLLPHKIEEVWANGPQFDCVILRHLFQETGVKVPWHYREERDLRTLMALARKWGIQYAHAYEGITPHDPLSDALHQAKVVQIVLNNT